MQNTAFHRTRSSLNSTTKRNYQLFEQQYQHASVRYDDGAGMSGLINAFVKFFRFAGV